MKPRKVITRRLRLGGALLLWAMTGSFLVPLPTTAATAYADTTVPPGSAPSSTPRSPSVSAAAEAPSEGLQPIVNERGHVSRSIAGVGSDGSGTLTLNKPAGSTLRGAYFFVATTGFRNEALTQPLTIDGRPAPLEHETPSGISSFNYWTNVTDLVGDKLNSAPAGPVPFTVVEPEADLTDGSVLVAIYDDPNQAEQTVTLLFGALKPEGDQYSIRLARPISLSDPATHLEMSLGISFSFQLDGTQQFSTVDVNGARLTSAAGGEDDGSSHNGALLTVGGEGDSDANPPDPNANPTNPRSDDELYDLRPFVKSGDQQIQVQTENPSRDDNIFLAVFTMNPPVTSIRTGTGLDVTVEPASGPEGSPIPLRATVENTTGSPASVTWSAVPGPGVDAGTTCKFSDRSSGLDFLNQALHLTGDPFGQVVAPSESTDFDATMTCTDDGPVVVTATASNGVDDPVSTSTVVQVTNVAPTVVIDQPKPGTAIPLGGQVSLSALFRDPGTNDSHTCAVDWGDGSVSAGAVAERLGGGTCTATHTYSSPGPFTIAVDVRDDDMGAAGGSGLAAEPNARATQPITVPAPSAVATPAPTTVPPPPASGGGAAAGPAVSPTVRPLPPPASPVGVLGALGGGNRLSQLLPAPL